MWLNPLERHTFLRRGEGSEVAWEMHGALQVSVFSKSLQEGMKTHFLLLLLLVFSNPTLPVIKPIWGSLI